LIVVLAGETLFQKTLEEAAEAVSAELLVLSEEEPFWAALQEATPEAVFVETGFSALDAGEIIQKLKSNPSTRRIPVVAFGDSLRADLLQDAKEAGADLTLARAAFRDQLSQLLRHYDKGHRA
jgi:PleD family two-component response regulator